MEAGEEGVDDVGEDAEDGGDEVGDGGHDSRHGCGECVWFKGQVFGLRSVFVVLVSDLSKCSIEKVCGLTMRMWLQTGLYSSMMLG